MPCVFFFFTSFLSEKRIDEVLHAGSMELTRDALGEGLGGYGTGDAGGLSYSFRMNGTSRVGGPCFLTGALVS